jgi:uncharacterized membrane-anchored protein YhcB (DUF1043 family)
MSSVSYYRKEAERCRELADHSPDADIARRWSALAADYDKLADALAASSATLMPLSRGTMQRQPMQQQQSKTEPEDK